MSQADHGSPGSPHRTPDRVFDPALVAVAFGGVALVGLALRVVGLGAWPLDAAEAEAALAALAVVNGQAPPSLAPSPGGLTVSLTALGFFLFGANDVTARLAPALLGTAAIAICWWLTHHSSEDVALSARPSFGRTSLATAAVIALSPTAIYASRRLSDDAFGLLLGLMVASFLLEGWLDGRSFPRKDAWLWVAVGVGLALSGGAAAFTAILASALCVVAASASGGWRPSQEGRPNGRRLALGAVVVAAIVIAATTAGFFYPQGLGLPGLDAWLRQFDGRGGPALPMTLLSLVAYEPLALVFGVASLALALLRKGRALSAVQKFALAWLGVGLATVFFAVGDDATLLLAVAAPLWLLAGDAIGRLVEAAVRASWAEAWRLLLPAAVATLFVGQAVSWLSGSAATDYRWLVLALVALIVLGVMAAAVVRGEVVVLAAGLALPLALAFELHSAVWLNHRPSPNEMFAGRSAVSEARAIAGKVAVASGDPAPTVLVDESLRQPFAWYWRDESAMAFGPAVAGPTLVVARDAAIDGAYATRTALLAARWQPTRFDAAAVWRWLVYREAYGPVSYDSVSLYLRR